MTNMINDAAAHNLPKKNRILVKIFCLRNFNVMLLFLIMAAGLYYLAGVNDVTVKGFVLQELKEKNSLLIAENKDIEAKVMALESYGNISERAEKLSMVSAGDIAYVAPGSGAVARR